MREDGHLRRDERDARRSRAAAATTAEVTRITAMLGFSKIRRQM
jgi:hypothetical protein